MTIRRPRRTGAFAVALVAAGAVAVTAPATGLSAVFGVQDDRMTIAEPIQNLQQRMKLVRRTNSKVARFDILWSEVAPRRPARPANHRDPAYNWGRADRVLSGMFRARITPILSVYSTPAWAVQHRARPFTSRYNPNAPDAAQFAAFMRAVSTRYAGRARHFEIWNEPNLRNFLSVNGRAHLGYYKKMVRRSYPAIKAGNRRARVIVGVGGPRSSTGGGNIGARPWMNGLLRDRRVPMDAYSQHMYPSRGPRFSTRSYNRAFPTWRSVPEIHRVLNQRRRGMKLYITEAGYTTAATPFRNVRVTPAQQNLFLRQMANLPAVRDPQTAAVIWFNLQDNINWPAGLLRENGQAKPSFRSFRSIANRPIPAGLRAELNPRPRR